MANLMIPSFELVDEFMTYIEHFRDSEIPRYGKLLDLDRQAIGEYINRINNDANGSDMGPGKVPQTTFWFLDGQSAILGTIRIRHELNDDLRREGGNIGYDVAPEYRGRGVATEMLSQAICYARKHLGMDEILITCDENNIASRRVIEKNGGVPIGSDTSPERGVPILRFIIR